MCLVITQVPQYAQDTLIKADTVYRNHIVNLIPGISKLASTS